jgi:guanylate kinase
MNELKELAKFKQILNTYKISPEGKDLLVQTKVVLMTAISASGRNTIIRELVKTGSFYFIVSDTTRQPRTNDGVLEQDGVEYWFRSEQEVLNDLKQGRFLEAAIIHNQQVSGISLRELEKARVEGKYAVTDIEVQGVHNIMAEKPDATAIFVLPPSYEEWQRRLLRRGNISDKEIDNRHESARKELQAALREPYYHFLINDELSEAVKGVQKIAEGKITARYDKRGREIAQDILYRLQQR